MGNWNLDAGKMTLIAFESISTFILVGYMRKKKLLAIPISNKQLHLIIQWWWYVR